MGENTSGDKTTESLIKLFAESISEDVTVLSVSLDRFSFDDEPTQLVSEEGGLNDLVFGIRGGQNYQYAPSDPDSEKKLEGAFKTYADSFTKFDLILMDIGAFSDVTLDLINPNGMLIVRKPSPQVDAELAKKAIERGKLPGLESVIDSDPLEYIYEKISKTDFNLNALIKFPEDDELSPRKATIKSSSNSEVKGQYKFRSFANSTNEFCLISRTSSPVTLFTPSSISDVYQITEAIKVLVEDGYVKDYPVVEKFINFRIHQAEREIASLNSAFKHFTTVPLSSLTHEIVVPSSYWRKNNTEHTSQKALFIPNRISDDDVAPLVILGDDLFNKSLESDQTKGSFMFRLECKSELDAKYLNVFFKSKLGRLILEASVSVKVNNTDKIDKQRLMSISIPTPDASTQERIHNAHQSLSKLETQIYKMQSELFINPLDSETNEKIASMLSATDNLTAEDAFRELVRLGESKTTEFKQTFQMCIHTGQLKPDIETSALKSIVGFMNADGGALLLGVADDQNIVGLDEELRKFHGKKGNPLDSYTLRLKDKIGRRIGKASLSLIDIKALNINGKDVFQVDCSMASEGVYLDDEYFYLRVPAATEQMKGPQLEKYLRQRFG